MPRNSQLAARLRCGQANQGQDRDGGAALLATVFGMFAFLRKLFAYSAYEGPIFQHALAGILPGLETEIVKRSDRVKGFIVLPKRWIVERTIAWLNRCRRLARNWENLNRNALAFLKLLPSASCRENSVIPHEVSGRTLSVAAIQRMNLPSHAPECLESVG